MIAQLHSILKPFILRRLKADVEYNLPPKKEYILNAPITEHQKGVYEAVVTGAIRRYLIREKSGVASDKGQPGAETSQGEASNATTEQGVEETNVRARMLRRRSDQRKPVYNVDAETDRDYFKRLDKGDYNAFEEAEENRRWGSKGDADAEGQDVGIEHLKKTAGKPSVICRRSILPITFFQ